MLDSISTKIFADGADLDQILQLAGDARIKGFTTNPSLMWKAGLTDYSEFARSLLERISDKPISFEVVADEPEDIGRQARMIATWGENVYVKVPVTTSTGESLGPLVRELSEAGIRVNVTARTSMTCSPATSSARSDSVPRPFSRVIGGSASVRNSFR